MTVTVRDYPGGRKEVDIRFQLPSGERFRKKLVAPITSESGARRWGEARERDLYAKALSVATGSTLPGTVPTLEQFATRFIDEFARAEQHKPSGIAAKETIIERHLKPRFGSTRLNEITDADIQKLKRDLRALSPKTVNNILSVLSKILKVAVAWRVILEMPARFTLLKVQDKDMTFYVPTVYRKLLSAATALGWRYELLLRLGGDLGLRRGEMIGILDSNVDTTRGVATIERNVVRGEDHGTKGLKVRRVPVTDAIVELVRTNVTRRGPLLRQPDGEPVTPKMLRIMMRAIQRKAGLTENGALHILRHTYCSHLAMAGVPVMEIQMLAGHAHLTTTIKYMHLAPGSEHREAVTKLDRLRAEAHVESLGAGDP